LYLKVNVEIVFIFSHVLNTGDLGGFCITNLTGTQSTLKVIECLTGEHASQVTSSTD